MYVNYGRIDDFLYLTNGTFLKLNLSKYICIARYGGIFRGDKVIEWSGKILCYVNVTGGGGGGGTDLTDTITLDIMILLGTKEPIM